jgi:hypothetical protein
MESRKNRILDCERLQITLVLGLTGEGQRQETDVAC